MPLSRADGTAEGTRRRRHRDAVLGSPAPPPDGRPALRTVGGTVVDASPHLLVLDTDDEEIRLPMTPDTSIWHGGRAGLYALRAGRRVIARPSADGPGIDRIWVDIVRVTGTILSYEAGAGAGAVEVDGGPHRGRTRMVIPESVLGRVLVRHPRLEPGYLIDVIGISTPGGPQAVKPGTSQPGHRAEHVVPPPPTQEHPPTTLQGTATWFGSAGQCSGVRGAAYPGLDSEGEGGGCPDAPVGCAPLPYLSYGSELVVRNECSERMGVVPVIECGCVAARYCDRCVECGTSPRGRIVELTPAAFADLGGELDSGCFNAALVFGHLLGMG